MKKRFVLLLFAATAIVHAFAQDKPKAGDVITGVVNLPDHPGSGSVIKEISSKGELKNATCSDENGVFSLRLVDPKDHLLVTCYEYDKERNIFIDYKIVTRTSSGGITDFKDYVYDITQQHFEINMDDYIIANARTERSKRLQNPWYYKQQDSLSKILIPLREAEKDKKIEDEIQDMLKRNPRGITVAGKKPKAGNEISGVIMDKVGPLKDAVISERDSRNNIVAETKAGSNGEFTLQIKDAKNHLCIKCDGYGDIRHIIDGNRFVIEMEELPTVDIVM